MLSIVYPNSKRLRSEPKYFKNSRKCYTPGILEIGGLWKARTSMRQSRRHQGSEIEDLAKKHKLYSMANLDALLNV